MAARSLHLSRPALLATPTSSTDRLTGPTVLPPGPESSSPEIMTTATKTGADATKYPDYSKGPSALDKAAQLFFFTEILRGMW